MDEIDPQAKFMSAGCVRQVITQLIFFLIAQNGERGDRGNELIVAERFQARGRRRGGTERKRQSESEIGIARLRKVQTAAAECEGTDPSGAKRKLLADGQIQIIVVRGRPGGWQRPLLHQSIAREVAVSGKAQEPLRAIGRMPIETQAAEII